MDADETRAFLESDEDAERIRQEDLMARQMGIQGVPCFIINRQYAVSGAQEPAVFLKAFEQVLEAEEAAANEHGAGAGLNAAALSALAVTGTALRRSAEEEKNRLAPAPGFRNG